MICARPTAILSRQLAAHRGKCLVINLPGKPAAIELCLNAVMPAVPYCLDLIGAAYIETDPARVKRTDPGTPEVCNIYHLHKAFSPPAVVEHVHRQCSTAGWGCIDCKKVLFEHMEQELVPIRTRAQELQASPGRVEEVLEAGAQRARAVAEQTIVEVRERMGLP